VAQLGRNRSHRGRAALTAAVSLLVGAACVLLPLTADAAPPAQTAAAAVEAARPAAALAADTRLATFDQQMITLINQARRDRGIAPLTEAVGLTRVSAWWSGQLSAGKTGYQLAHNPDAWTMVAADGAANRTSWGENVAWSSSTASTAQEIFTAYMNSPGHRANILSTAYRFVGMGTVGGGHGLWNTTEFTDQVQPGQAVAPPAPKPTPKPTPAPTQPGTRSRFPDGSFIRDTSNGFVYRIAGGAPVFITTWVPFGGPKSAAAVSPAEIAATRTYPADGTFVRWAGNVYVMAGGAPVHITSWAPYGRVSQPIDLDPAAADRAGSGGQYNHLRSYPADGTLLLDLGVKVIYEVAGGAPLRQSSWAAIGGVRPWVDLDPAALTGLGRGGIWNHLRHVPADNTYLRVGRKTYQVRGGTARFIATWAEVGGPKPVTLVDDTAFRHLGPSGGPGYLLAVIG